MWPLSIFASSDSPSSSQVQDKDKGDDDYLSRVADVNRDIDCVVRASTVWCMPCFRSALRVSTSCAEEVEAEVSSDIVDRALQGKGIFGLSPCAWAYEDQMDCENCFKESRVCYGVPALLEAEWADLFEAKRFICKWIKRRRNNKARGPFLDEWSVENSVVVLITLCQAFSALEKYHRRHYNLPTGEGEACRESIRHYEQLVASRRARMSQNRPMPPRGLARQDCAEYWDSLRLTLEYGDPGLESWRKSQLMYFLTMAKVADVNGLRPFLKGEYKFKSPRFVSSSIWDI